MTQQRPLVVELKDILAVTLRCKKCAVRLSMEVKAVHPDQLRQCPACGANWVHPAGEAFRQPTVTPLYAFLDNLAPLVRNDEGGCTILLEFEGLDA